MKAHRVLITVLWLTLGGRALAAEINVLSAGAVEPGLVAAADLFRQKTGNDVKIRFATAPAIRQRMTVNESADIVMAPPAVLDDLTTTGKVDAQVRVTVGRVGVGVAVREGAPVPDVSTPAALKVGSSGAYVWPATFSGNCSAW